MKEHIIVDLDNCISNDGWRIPKIKWDKFDPSARYHDYHSLSGFDEVANLLIFDQHPQASTIIFTARPVFYRAVTEEWLKRKKVPYEYLVMRNNHDFRSSVQLKQTMLEWLPDIYDINLDQIVAAYDDLPEVVEMYRKHGIIAHTCEIHSVCAYTNPNLKEVM